MAHAKKKRCDRLWTSSHQGWRFSWSFWASATYFQGRLNGASTNIPWAINLWGANRHPSQIYEILAAFAVFAALRLHPFGKLEKGQSFTLLLALSAFSALLLEAWRGDSLILAGGFRATQIISLVVLLISLWLLTVWGKSEKAQMKRKKAKV